MRDKGKNGEEVLESQYNSGFMKTRIQSSCKSHSITEIKFQHPQPVKGRFILLQDFRGFSPRMVIWPQVRNRMVQRHGGEMFLNTVHKKQRRKAELETRMYPSNSQLL